MYGNLLPEFMISHISSGTSYNVVSGENSRRKTALCLAEKTAWLAIKLPSLEERKTNFYTVMNRLLKIICVLVLYQQQNKV